MELTVEEGRVLGCLVEKQLTTPQQYPLTENALLAACNQSTSRDPVVQYDVGTVRLAVRSLRERGLVRTVHRPGERSEKHRHLLAEMLDLSPAQQAVLALLLLRGPQTVAELRLRSERMRSFASSAELQEALHALSDRSEPLAELLARSPGQKEARYADLLVGTGTTAVDSASPAPDAPDAPAVSAAAPASDIAGLAAQVRELRAEVAQLRAELRTAREPVPEP